MASLLTGLPDDLRQRVRELASDLSQFITDAREEFDNRSERWRDSADGVAVDGWIDEVGQVADALEDLAGGPAT